MTIDAVAIKQPKHTASKLSQGAKNTSHKLYVSNEKRINAALCKNIARRSTEVDVK